MLTEDFFQHVVSCPVNNINEVDHFLKWLIFLYYWHSLIVSLISLKILSVNELVKTGRGSWQEREKCHELHGFYMSLNVRVHILNLCCMYCLQRAIDSDFIQFLKQLFVNTCPTWCSNVSAWLPSRSTVFKSSDSFNNNKKKNIKKYYRQQNLLNYIYVYCLINFVVYSILYIYIANKKKRYINVNSYIEFYFCTL